MCGRGGHSERRPIIRPIDGLKFIRACRVFNLVAAWSRSAFSANCHRKHTRASSIQILEQSETYLPPPATRQVLQWDFHTHCLETNEKILRATYKPHGLGPWRPARRASSLMSNRLMLRSSCAQVRVTSHSHRDAGNRVCTNDCPGK